MTYSFRPVNARTKLSLIQIKNAYVHLKELHENANLDIHQCLHHDNFILINYDGNIQSDTTITVKTPRKLKDKSREFPREFQPVIRKVEQELALTNKLIRQLKKEIKNLQTKGLQISEQIKYIEEMALRMKEQDDLNKTYRRLLKSYQVFYDCLNDNLLDFEEKKNR